MSSFKSDTSKLQAQSTVNKLLSTFVPGAERISTDQSQLSLAKKRLSSAQLVHNNATHKRMTEEEFRKQLKKQKVMKRKQLKVSKETSAKVNKMARYQIIKKHYDDNVTDEAETKYMEKLIRRNVNSVKSWDNERDSEIMDLQNDLLKDKFVAKAGKKKRTKASKKNDFTTKVKKGVLAYPGLTPGLAPVGLSDDEDSDDE
ncbi:hypothetical protein BABINDRAFT_162072 [Babjeviella inositovora NRRL Y-12698]|uniref:Regulator of rDNA transcription 14 n=1 Tax=Babjeviella inositovora NRRL Y-12698 TaxID=984486 RepID=A0A1E3QMT8_9ASCO|nr:uncharacterized protein BABINDRAFT_162072 [Babjeviella inositovora NRRL Y-12698]ODQ78993.1 hypothetical protein BABINDRAFT_162072 [Babjeviella inositovora NRRL Y-12698]